MNFFDTVQSF